MSDCERIPGTGCSLCTAPDVATQIVDDEGVVLASCEGTDYEGESTPCCSKCLSPDVTTELFSGEPWEVGFNPGIIDLTDTLFSGLNPVYYLFRIYAGLELPYVGVGFESPYDWPEDAVGIYEWDTDFESPDFGGVLPEDVHLTGTAIQPTDLLSVGAEGTNLVIFFDPAYLPTGGMNGGVARVTIGSSGGSGSPTVMYVEAPVGTPTASDNIRSETHYALAFQVAAGGSTVARPFSLEQNLRSVDIYWTMDWAPDITCPGTLLVDSGSFTVTSPSMTNSLTIDPALLNPTDSPIHGKLTLKGYLDALHTDPMNEDPTRPDDVLNVIVYIDQVYVYFDISIEYPIIRDEVFDITVTARNSETDEVVPAFSCSVLHLYLVCDYAPVDVLSSGSSSPSWSGGVSVISGVSVTGGAGSEIASLGVYDLASGTAGSDDVDILDSLATDLNVAATPGSYEDAWDGLYGYVSTDLWVKVATGAEVEKYSADYWGLSHLGVYSWIGQTPGLDSPTQETSWLYWDSSGAYGPPGQWLIRPLSVTYA